MKKVRGAVVALAVALALWYLYPTLKFYTLSEEARSRMSPEEISRLSERAVKLGLDLKGGMYLVLEVDLSKLRPEERKDAVDRAMQIITNRVDQFGVAEPVVQRQGKDRIIVELPGLKDIDRAMKLIGQTAQLEFKLLKPKDERDLVLKKMDEVLAVKKPKPKGKAEELFQEAPEDTFLLSHPITGLMYRLGGEDLGVRAEDVPKVKELLSKPEVQKVIPPDGEFLWAAKPEVVGGEKYYRLYYLKKRPEMTGAMIKDARPDVGSGYDPSVAGRPIVRFSTTKDGVRLFARITGANIGRRLAIVLDRKVFSAPVIRTRIPRGNGQITGLESMQEAKDLAIVLRTGALPAPVKIINKQVVGPSLGADSIRKGVKAALIGLVLVVVFMVAYYRLCGLIADLALILNLVFLVAALAGLRGTLTLPGIAGIILTIGMSVDANVLIFERIREELRQGRTALRAISNGYSQAFRTILDANLTTLITAVVLYQFGTGPIRGFATTLSLGIIFSMFTAVVVTRVILDALVGGEVAKLSIGESLIRNPRVDFVKVMRYAFLGSSSAIAAGLLFFVFQGPVYGIDFTGGTLLEVHFKEPVSVAEIRQALSEVPFEGTKVDLSDSEIKEFGSSNTFLVRFGNLRGEPLARAVRERIKQAFAGRLGENWLVQEVDVGPKIGGEMRGKAVKAILYSMLGILIYITWRFEFRFAVAAIIALFHDVLFTAGFLTILRQEFTMPVVAALLTIVGYSLNDTIVVFDRIREKLRAMRRASFSEVVNLGINETLARTLITSFTTLIVVLALLTMGGRVIHGFALALTAGVFVGTYSSIFIASPILVAWRERSERRRQEKVQVRRKR